MANAEQKNFDVNALDKLKGKETTVNPEDEKALKAVLEDKDGLFKNFLGTHLEKNVKQKMGEILKEINPERLRAIYEKLNPEQRKNLETIFKKLENKENGDKIRAINTVLRETKIQLDNFQGQVMEQNAASIRNFRENAQSHTETKPSSEASLNSISKAEKKNLNKILDGDFLVEEKMNKTEKSLKSDFKKLIDLVGNTASLAQILRALKNQADSKIALPNWANLFKKENGEAWTEKELNKLQQAYLAYLESKKDNGDLSRWNRVMNALESGVLNGEKSLDVIYQENVSKPISKKERKQGLEDEQWKFRLELAKDGKASEWKNNYMQQNREDIQSMQQNWLYEGYSGSEISQMTKDYLDSKFDSYTKKEWKKHLKEEQKNGIQKSDLGNFRILVDSIKDQTPEDQLSALLTDTNFDGVRNHLDGKGNKRGDQIDLALRMAKAEGLSMDDIVKNIVIHLHTKKGETFGGTVPISADKFANWLKSDIKHARLVQSALMDTPENAVDIMRYGTNALKKTLEAQRLTPEEQQMIADKINTDPATRDLSQQARDALMANLSGYLLAKMREPGVNANVNGLGVGMNVPLNQILKGLSFNLGTGASLEGQPYAGVSIAWNTEVAKWGTGNISAGINAGTTLGVVPIYGLRAGFEQDLNTKKVLGNIDPTSLKTFSAGVNATMIGQIPSFGASVGFEKNQLSGIEKQSNHIKKEISPIIEKLLTKDKDGNYPDIITTLKTLFNTSSDAEIKKAAENLTSVLERTKADNLEPKESSQLIGERYAESWRNNAIQGLPKGWKFTGASLGVQFLAGFFPVASLSATLTKYKNLSHSDSPESRARLQQSIDTGRGDRTRESIQKKDFENIRNQLQAMNVLNPNDKLETNQNGDLVLSQSLLNKVGFTVKINDKLKGYLKSENGTLIIPAGISYRFLTSARTNGSTTELNIGYEGKGSKNLTTLRADNLKAFEGSKDYGLDQNITGLASALGKLDFSVWANGILFKHHPTEKDIKIDPDGKVYQGTKDQKRKEVGMLTKDSGLAIDRDGNVSITKEKGKVTKESVASLTLDQKLNDEVNSLFSKSTIDGLIKLSKQRAQFDNFKGFLANAKAMKAEYIAAAEDLMKMLPDAHYSGLKTALGIKEENGKKEFANPELATQIMDRLKAVFATVPESQKASRNAVVNLATQRNREYTKYHGKSVLEDFSAGKLKIDYVGLAGQLSDHPQPKPMENLIGFTAFYRRNAGDARGMSMTAYGQTNVLDKIFPLEDEQKDQAKSWLLDNLNKQPYQLKAIAKSMGKFDKATQGVDENGNLSLDSIKALLSGKSIDLGKQKITLNTKIVKYFLAECANESIGIQIDGITIEDSQQVTQEPTTMTFNSSEATARANVEQQKFSVGLSFGGGKKEQAKKEESGKKREDGQGESNPNIGDSPDVPVNPDIPSVTPEHGTGSSGTTIGETQDTIVSGATDE